MSEIDTRTSLRYSAETAKVYDAARPRGNQRAWPECMAAPTMHLFLSTDAD